MAARLSEQHDLNASESAQVLASLEDLADEAIFGICRTWSSSFSGSFRLASNLESHALNPNAPETPKHQLGFRVHFGHGSCPYLPEPFL